MIKKFNLVALMLLITCVGITAKTVKMPDLTKPAYIKVADGRLYTVQKGTIHIFSLKDFKLIKKFGKLGTGPQEFRVARIGTFLDVDLHILKDRLHINSLNKISYFSKDGKFISEKTLKFAPVYLTPLGKGYVGRYAKLHKQLRWHTWITVNADVQEPKEIYAEKTFWQRGQKLRVVSRRASHFLVHDEKLFIEDKAKGIIQVFDNTGKKLYVIDPKLKQMPFTAEDKKKLIEFFMADPIIRPQYEGSKHLTVYDSHFPHIWRMFADNNKLYILTYEKKGEKQKFYILDLNKKGKLIKTLFLPVVQMDGEKPYPITISNSKLYHLVENLDDEDWELHITGIK